MENSYRRFSKNLKSALFWLGFFAAPSGFSASFSLNEVSKHSRTNDCWIIIEGRVYDITTYIDKHPAPKSLLADACGKDATEGWNTKGKDKPHSRKATALLKNFLKGNLSGRK